MIPRARPMREWPFDWAECRNSSGYKEARLTKVLPLEL